MKIDRHVFGSYKGYTTLAKSPGISVEDARQLEGGVYGFGQTEDRHYAKSLRARPAFFTRVLTGSRRGLTRVFEGAPDSDGRPTNVMITAILSNADWDAKLCGDIWLLLPDKHLWQWPGGAQIPELNRDYPSPPTTISRKSALRVAALISEIEKRWGAGPPVIVGDQFGSEEIRAVEMLIPAKNRPQFTSASRTLSPQLAVTLNRLAAEAPTQQINFRYDPAAPNSPYAEFLIDFGLTDGHLPIAEAMTYRDFGHIETKVRTPRPSYVPPPMPEEEHRSNRLIWTAVVAVALLLLGGIYVTLQKSRLITTALSSPATTPQIRPLPDPSTTQLTLSSQQIRTASTAVQGKSDNQSAVTAASANNRAQSATTSPAQEAVVPPARQSKQDRDLARLQNRWDDFFHLISRESLTFSEDQSRELTQIQQQVRRDHLATRVELGATGSIAALPAFIDLRDKYFQLNRLLSDPNLKDITKLRAAEIDLETATKRLKVLLNSLSIQPQSQSIIFSKMDRTIISARVRLRESRTGL